MSIRVLNCASMFPRWPRWQVGGVCLLVDTDQGPVLVDTGLGLHDHLSPSPLVKFFLFDFGIKYLPVETAIHRLPCLGVDPHSVQHIVLTHLHFDHAGGLPDFPWAQVHLHSREHAAHLKPRTWIERFAYDRQDFLHHPNWMLYDQPVEKWFDFDAIRLPFAPAMFLIPLFGHTSGHCGVAIQEGDGWLFQAADSIPLSADFTLAPDWSKRLILGKQYLRIKQFHKDHPEVHLLAGHAWLRDFK